MSNESMARLIHEFESVAKTTGDLTNAMTGFEKVLSKFYKAHNEIQELREELEQSKASEKLSETSAVMLEVNKKTLETLDDIGTTIGELSMKSQDEYQSLVKIEEKLMKYLEVNDHAAETLEKINALHSDRTERLLSQMDKKFNDLVKKIDELDRIANNDYLLNKIELIDKRINATNRIITDYVEKNQKMQEETHERVLSSFERYNDQRERMNNEINELIESNKSLKATIDHMSQENIGALEAFSNLADEWAAENLYGLAVKNKKK